jgi:hypothetical protein
MDFLFCGCKSPCFVTPVLDLEGIIFRSGLVRPGFLLVCLCSFLWLSFVAIIPVDFNCTRVAFGGPFLLSLSSSWVKNFLD